MKLAIFDTHTYDREALAAANARYAHDLTFFEPRLTRQTASMATIALSFGRATTTLTSPHAVAEHTVGLILALNRKIHRAYNRVRDANFSVEGLADFDLVVEASVAADGKAARRLRCASRSQQWPNAISSSHSVHVIVSGGNQINPFSRA